MKNWRLTVLSWLRKNTLVALFSRWLNSLEHCVFLRCGPWNLPFDLPVAGVTAKPSRPPLQEKTPNTPGTKAGASKGLRMVHLGLVPGLGFSNFHAHNCGLVQMQILTWLVWGGVQDSAFPPSSLLNLRGSLSKDHTWQSKGFKVLAAAKWSPHVFP